MLACLASGRDSRPRQLLLRIQWIHRSVLLLCLVRLKATLLRLDPVPLLGKHYAILILLLNDLLFVFYKFIAELSFTGVKNQL